jgi:hypothetical protein
MDINPQGECLMGYLVSININMLNKGKKPTFVISYRKRIIDLALGTDKIGDLVNNWHVFDEISLQTTDKQYFNWMTWKIPGSDITTPREPIKNPIRKT